MAEKKTMSQEYLDGNEPSHSIAMQITDPASCDTWIMFVDGSVFADTRRCRGRKAYRHWNDDFAKAARFWTGEYVFEHYVHGAMWELSQPCRDIMRARDDAKKLLEGLR